MELKSIERILALGNGWIKKWCLTPDQIQNATLEFLLSLDNSDDCVKKTSARPYTEKMIPIQDFKVTQTITKCFSENSAQTVAISEDHGSNKTIGKRWFFDEEQYVNGERNDNFLVELDSCLFLCDGNTVYIRKQTSCYLLVIDEQRFAAKVDIKLLNGLDLNSIENVKAAIFNEIDINHILEDELAEEWDQSVNKIAEILKLKVNNEESIESLTIVLLALGSVGKNFTPKEMLETLKNNNSLPEELNTVACDLLKMKRATLGRELSPFFFKWSPCLNLASVIHTIYETGVTRYRDFLTRQCLPSLPNLKEKIEALPSDRILHIRKAEVELFQHLFSINDEHNALLFVEDIIDRFFYHKEPITEYFPVNPILSFIFKSFCEIMTEIRKNVDNITYSDLLSRCGEEWKLADTIEWPSTVDCGRQYFYSSLECQYRFLFSLIKHFSREGNLKKTKFEYRMRLIDGPRLDINGSYQWNKVQTFSPDVTAGDCIIWLYLLDHTLDTVIIDKILSASEFFGFYEPIITCYSTFLATLTSESHESLRVVTRNILNFIVQTCSIVQTHSTIQFDILSKQIFQLMSVKNSEKFNFSCFKDLINNYNEFWGHQITARCSNSQNFLADQVNNLFNRILDLTSNVLDKLAPVDNLTNALRSINEFLSDFENAEFPAKWYVKRCDEDVSGLAKVSNELSDERDCSYLVTDVAKFLESLSGQPPPHYNIQIIKKLVDCAFSALEKSWISEKELVAAQLDAIIAVFDALKGLMVHLDGQPQYRDFSKYENESTEPFARALKSDNLDEFRKRVETVSESFRYLRKTDEIGIEKALVLMEPIFEDPVDEDILKTCYDRYFALYQDHIQNSVSKTSIDEKILAVVDALRSCRVGKNVQTWDGQFKMTNVPEMLAGLSAVWTLTKSEDVSPGAKLIRPHCVQILCVFRLLSVDKSRIGVNNHLAQILTGQGKSLVLALISALLALTDHDVYMVCYSKHLVTRDERDFEKFFKVLGIATKIKYITIRGLAEKCMEPVINGKNRSLRNCVYNHVINKTPLPKLTSASFNFKNTALLVDEVDVFFGENVYGAVENPCSTIKVPGLGKIQEHMWELAKRNCSSKDLLRQTYDYIENKVKSKDTIFVRFDELRSKEGDFAVLVVKNDELVVRKYTSVRKLIDENFEEMANAAVDVNSRESLGDSIINEKGLLCNRNPIDGTLTSYFKGYYHVFKYFRLKKKNFDDMFGENYGYLFVNAGYISYAKLPSEFLLLLGVSGTLSNIYSHEMQAMREAYNIVSYTAVPSFFGSSNIKFDPNRDLVVLESVEQWKRVLFDRAYAQIKSERAVMVFFNLEKDITSFVDDFGDKFASLIILTENTEAEAKEFFICRTGIPCTLTLATRRMGRGIDYKSSSAVERNGGVHVIQAFFSTDNKEEAQIKGRTGRKDNKGSFELILCREHLADDGLMCGNKQTSYDELNERRTELARRKGEENSINAKKYLAYHETTMKYYGLG